MKEFEWKEYFFKSDDFYLYSFLFIFNILSVILQRIGIWNVPVEETKRYYTCRVINFYLSFHLHFLFKVQNQCLMDEPCESIYSRSFSYFYYIIKDLIPKK